MDDEPIFHEAMKSIYVPQTVWGSKIIASAMDYSSLTQSTKHRTKAPDQLTEPRKLHAYSN